MSIKPKKLVQTVVLEGTNPIYITPTNTQTQVSEIWILNDSRSLAIVDLYVGGTESRNKILKEISIPPGATAYIHDCKIIMESEEEFFINIKYSLSEQDGSTSITMFGIEEDLS